MGEARVPRGNPISFNDPLLSKRSVINVGSASQFHYAFINHFLSGDACVGPYNTAFTTTTNTWPQYIDADGWPNVPVGGEWFAGSIRLPASADFGGNYTITWTGDGEVLLNSGTWTVNAGLSSNYTEVSNGRYTNTPGLVPKIVVSVTGFSHPTLLSVIFLSTDPNSAGRFLKNFKFYRTADEARLQSGKVFRTAFLQSLVNLNPSAIRCMDMHGGNDARNCRFENRTLPSAAGYSGRSNWVASPAYGKASFVDGVNANQYTLAAVTSGARQTAASMVHGEIVTCLINTAAVRNGTFTGGGVFRTVTSISKASNGRVVCASHGFETGDTIVHLIPTGMTQLHKFPCVITKIDANTYDLNVNTSGFSTFTAGTANQFITLQVGSGNDRTKYPVIFSDGTTYASTYGDGYLKLRQYQTFYFDKTLSAQNDSSGNPIYGVWIFLDNSGGAHPGDVPAEICVALVNEVNELALSQGKTNTTHLWLNIPHWGLSSMDPDYSAASNFAVKTMDVVLNGANGYPGLALPASVLLEDDNETWNTAGAAFTQALYLAARGVLRWPSTSSLSDFASMAALRSTVMVRDVKAATGNTTRIRYVLAGQGFLGYNSGTLNGLRCLGTASYLTDALVTGGNFGTPISNHDAFAHGTYFDAGDDTHYYGPGKGIGTFTDDSAMYQGLNNTVNGGGNYSGAANQSQAIANFVAAVVGGGGQSCNYYCSVASPAAGKDAEFAAAMVALGKKSITYEGGPDWISRQGANEYAGYGPLSAGDAAFKRAVQNSAAWGTAQTNYFNAKCTLAGIAMPGVYFIVSDFDGLGTTLDQRWAYASPDTYAGGTEGQALLNNGAWVAMGARNQALTP